ncbi:MAG: methyltransferase domain-containing protein [Myxococcales bacterium]|nr:methyltransferase domain-containing protein [Myxococcales bacterium]
MGAESDKSGFTERWDSFYSRYADAYDWAVKYLPLWKNWLKRAIPEIKGPRVLEVSFGTGYLMSRYADKFDTYGIDYNAHMLTTTADNLKEKGLSAHLSRGDVEQLPYADESFNTIVDTMAFSGYPDAEKALSEIMRVLKHEGKLVLIDFDHPNDGNWLGSAVAKSWEAGGDIIHDLKRMFDKQGLEYSDKPIGGFGSVHLYVVKKPALSAGRPMALPRVNPASI